MLCNILIYEQKITIKQQFVLNEYHPTKLYLGFYAFEGD